MASGRFSGPRGYDELLKGSGILLKLRGMRHQIDILVGGILCAVLLTALAPGGGTVPQGGGESFPASCLLTTAVRAPSDPSPEMFQQMEKMGRVLVGQHLVTPQDTLNSLARLYGSSADFLRSTNRLDSLALSPGKALVVHNGKGMLHQVRDVKGRTENLQDIAKRYNKPPQKIALANRLPGVALLSEKWVQPGATLFIPDARLRFTDYVLPVAWARGKRFISSGFGMRFHPLFRSRRFHTGWDMPRPFGFPVKAAREGRVVFSGWRGGYGRLVIVKHSSGLRTWYGHLSKTLVSAGDKVQKGQLIGKVGSTGLSTGPHLHFEVRDRFGNSINPKKFLS